MTVHHEVRAQNSSPEAAAGQELRRLRMKGMFLHKVHRDRIAEPLFGGIHRHGQLPDVRLVGDECRTRLAIGTTSDSESSLVARERRLHAFEQVRRMLSEVIVRVGFVIPANPKAGMANETIYFLLKDCFQALGPPQDDSQMVVACCVDRRKSGVNLNSAMLATAPLSLIDRAPRAHTRRQLKRTTLPGSSSAVPA
jgi:hypothetical protein